MLGGGRPEGIETGYFVEPTIFADVDNSMTIAREEIFGPVICVIPYDSVDEAVKIANDSDYGLAGSVYTTDVEKGLEIASRVRTGTYGINWYAFDPGSPFGGYKNSGIGRENGPEGVEAYCETKSVLYPLGYEADPGKKGRICTFSTENSHISSPLSCFGRTRPQMYIAGSMYVVGSTSGSCFLRDRTVAGIPVAIESAGTSWVTTALAPIALSSPITTGPRTFAPAPTVTRLPSVG